MILDNGQTLSTSQAITVDAFQDEDAIDLLSSTGAIARILSDPAGGNRMSAVITVGTSFASATAGATVNFRMLSSPADKALTGSGTGSTSGNTIGEALHGYGLGQPIIPTADGTITGITLNDVHYAVPADENNFRLATTWANALAGTTVPLGGTNDTVAWNIIPTEHGSTGAIPHELLVAGSQFVINLNPICGAPKSTTSALTSHGVTSVSGTAATWATNRYLFLYIDVSATMTAGVINAELLHNAQVQNGDTNYPTAKEVVG